jgi:N-acetylglucosamine kinase-like BadF-type ATPase
MQPRLVVAADGGNSKTDLVLATTDGVVLARVTGPGTRPYRDGLAATADALARLVGSAMGTAGTARVASGLVAVGSFYLANVDVPDEETAMHAALAEREVAEEIEVANDTLAVLRAGCTRGWGIAVVAGAGINAVGRYRDGRTERFLGIGPWSGDWGGGDGVVRSAVAAAVRAGDGRGPATILRERIQEAFGMDVDAVALDAHHHRIEQARLLALTPLVFAAAHAGDAVATEIVQRVGDEVASFAGALLRRMDLMDADPEVVLGGSMLQAQDPLVMSRARIGITAVAPAAQLRVLDVPPVLGPLASALTIAGANAEAISRARGYLLG